MSPPGGCVAVLQRGFVTHFSKFLFFWTTVSPYLKSLSMVAANKLLHLLEAFSTPWFLFSSPQNHHLVFFLLEIFNNIIQYQFDGEPINVTPAKRYQTWTMFTPKPVSQVTPTWCTPSSANAAFSTSWPTCPLTWHPSRRPCRRRETLACPGPSLSHQRRRRTPESR